ncbi:MAG: hypothetical protein IB618_01080 [Candidatus Pacearchaeota archaeon]|nr:MAG: hypothetical protein IB618_01080 [Candidatus Pacearchaeota archaeon]
MALVPLILYLFSQLISPFPGGHQYTVKEYYPDSDSVKAVKILRNYKNRMECDFVTGQATLIVVDNNKDINPDQLFVLSRIGKGAAAQYIRPQEQKDDFEASKKFMQELYNDYYYNKDNTQKNRIPEFSLMPDGGYQFIIYEDDGIKMLRSFDKTNSAEGWSLKDDTTFVVLDQGRDGKPEYAIKIVNGNGEYYTLSKPENFEERYKSEDLMKKLYREDKKARGIK